MTTLDETAKLRKEIETSAQNLENKKKRLLQIERECRHSWGEVTPDHIYHKAYTIPGDPPGTMGVDWRGPCYVPAETEKRWKRVCKICGKVEYTKHTKDKVEKIPVF